MADHYRSRRLSQLIEKEVNDILLKKVRDPRVQDITITSVSVTGDLQQANIYYSILSDQESDLKEVQRGLNKATGLMRRELGQRLDTYRTPELIFKHDESIQYGDRIDQLLQNLKHKN